MGRRKKITSDPDQLEHAMTETITVDYNGRAAKQKNQRPVAHTYSPRILNMYKDGVGELILNPGVNVLDREVYDLYVSEQVDAKGLLARGEIKVLDGLPDHQAIVSGSFTGGTGGLICRTRTQAGLDWIQSQTSSIGDAGLREEVTDLISNRRPYANAADFESVPFVDHTPGVATISVQPRA